ncbi:MAG: caspase family protein [Bacteroidota bacterium]
MDTSGFYDLKYAHKDALDFISFLNSPKSGAQWKISQFINSEAKTVELKKKIQEILIGKANPNDLIYIFFSGHGRVSDYNSNENYLLGYDFDPNDIYSQIEDDWLYKQITDSQASHIVLFVDACRSGMLQHKGGESNELFFNQVNMSSPQKIIITSGSNNQLSYESDKLQNGIFSYFLIKGLNGAAIEKDDPNVVNLDELREYLRENVCKYKKQVPAVGGKITDDTFPLSIRIPDNDK